MKQLLALFGRIFQTFFGRPNWQAPPWLVSLGRLRRERPGRYWGYLLLLGVAAAALGGGYWYYQSLPQPRLLAARLQAPGITPKADVLRPEPLRITFAYQAPAEDEEDSPSAPSVARLDLVAKKLAGGVRLTPPLPGTWSWWDEGTLVFQPEADWPAGTGYQVHFDPAIFAPEIRLQRRSESFITPLFKFKVKEFVFYQDPADPALRKGVATLEFTHPVEPQSLEQHLRLAMRPSGADIQTAPQPVAFTVSYDKNRREAYVHSAPLTLPEQPNTLWLKIPSGIATAVGGKPSADELQQQLLIPDRYSYLQVSRAATTIVRNEQDEPEQVLTLEFTDFIAERELLPKLQAVLLPEYNRQRNGEYWNSPREVTDAELAEATPVPLSLIPNPRDNAQAFSFRYSAPEDRYLYVRIPAGLPSVNDFVTSSLYDTVLRVPSYPREVHIMGDGSVLTRSGSHELSLRARGLGALRVNVGRLLPEQLNHLVSQTSGDITDLHFDNYNFSANDIVEYDHAIISLKQLPPQKANYTSFDLSDQLPADAERFGLFFVRVTGWDPRHKRETGESDQRLVLVSDLGLLVKDNADQSHHLFVMSLTNGQPVAGARVELIGRNGQPLFSRESAADGHVQFPSTKGFEREQQPMAYVARLGRDASFLPFERAQRRLDFSRFDVGGEWSGGTDELNAFLFSDRGIYRPGEEVEVGLIVKDRELESTEGIPLEVAVRGPRGNEVATHKLSLPARGFFDYRFPTTPTTETGSYQVALYLIRDGKYRDRQLGDTTFRVEEFAPDTMRIETTLLGLGQQRWFSAPSLEAEVRLQNLFGRPAQDRRVTARMTVRSSRFAFPEYRDFLFADPYYDPKAEPLRVTEDLPEQRSNQDGEALFTLPLERFERGTYLLSLETQGFEPGDGRSVTARNNVLLSPLDTLVGYKSDTDLSYINRGAQQSVDLLAVGRDLQPRDLGELRLRLLEVQTLSTLVKQPNGTFNYQSVKRERELHSEPFAIAAVGTGLPLPTDEPGDYLYEVVDKDDLPLARIPFSVVGHGNLLGRLEKSAELQVKLNKADYQAGEEIEMNIVAPYQGAGLISIESDRLHAFRWFQSTTTGSMQTIRIPEGMEGNAYVNVTFVRAVDSKEIFTSPLSYSVTPFTIDRSKRTLPVDLDVAPQVKPGEEMTIGYATAAPSRLLVFAVDEGILQVAEYVTPQPLNHFLRKRALQVGTQQLLDLLLPEFDLVREVAASGGGADAREALAHNLNPFSRLVDQPAVFWSGIVDADNQKREIKFAVPDSFSGTLRVMAVAVGDSAMGVTERSTLVRGPFVLTPSVLTQTAPGDRFRVSVGVTNLVEESGDHAAVTLRVEPSSQLAIDGPTEQQLTIGEGDEQRADFMVKALDGLGGATLRFTASLGDEQRRRTVGLSIRPAVPYRTSLVSGFSGDSQAELPLERRLYASLAEQRAAADRTPLVLVDGLSSYLEHFPHGCTEQVVSQVFPMIGLLSHSAFRDRMPDRGQRFDLLIQRLRERQLPNGGFCFWPGSSQVAEFPTVYALHFLIEGRDLGYPVPADLLARGRDYLREFVGNSSSNLDQARVRAYAVYLLTRLGDVTTNYLVDLQTRLEENKSNDWRRDLTAAYMAAAYQLLHKESAAAELISGYPFGAEGRESFGDFLSPLSRDGQYLFLLARHFPQRALKLQGEDLLRLIEPVFRGRYNTISAAYTILALGAWSQLQSQSPPAEIRFFAVDGTGKEQPLTANDQPFPTAALPVTAEQVRIQADQAIFYLASQAGFDRELPTKVLREGLEIVRDYLDESGQEVTTTTQGSEVTVRLRIRALNQPVSNVALIDLLPGGFEVNRTSVPRTASGWQAAYVDIREDRVVFYGDFDTTVRELRYQARATAAGSFVIPAALAESMYDRAIRAGTLPGRFEVTAPQ
jgi:hypothetical protein